MIDSSGVGALVSLYKRIRAQGGDVSLVLTGAEGTVFRIELPGEMEGV